MPEPIETLEVKNGILVVKTTIPENSSEKGHTEISIDQSLVEAESNVVELEKKLSAAKVYRNKMLAYKDKFKE